jgi:hypothetical protein
MSTVLRFLIERILLPNLRSNGPTLLGDIGQVANRGEPTA